MCGVHWRRVTRASGSKESEWGLGVHRETVPRKRGQGIEREKGSELARIRLQVTVRTSSFCFDSIYVHTLHLHARADTSGSARSRAAIKDGASYARTHAHSRESNLDETRRRRRKKKHKERRTEQSGRAVYVIPPVLRWTASTRSLLRLRVRLRSLLS